MKSLIVGKGQVGTSLFEVISPFHGTLIKDVEDLEVEDVEVLHLCFPYTDKFIEAANVYIAKYRPKLTINHASVPVGTTEKLSGNCVYSPIRGKHPNMANDIKVFTKFVAGDKEAADLAREYFVSCNLETVWVQNIRSLEFCKLMSNVRYGYEICFMQEAERIANKLGADINMFLFFEADYNSGYDKLNQGNMKRPLLYGGLIGGHCVMQNADIINEQAPSEMINWMRFSNIKKSIEKGE
jgi:UDP-N-acetyl-D-mannosaminuronate dehydrogenase